MSTIDLAVKTYTNPEKINEYWSCSNDKKALQDVIYHVKEYIEYDDITGMTKLLFLLSKVHHLNIFRSMLKIKKNLEFLKLNRDKQTTKIFITESFSDLMTFISTDNYKEYKFYIWLRKTYPENCGRTEICYKIKGEYFHCKVKDEITFLLSFVLFEKKYKNDKDFLEYFEEVCRITDFSDEYK